MGNTPPLIIDVVPGRGGGFSLEGSRTETPPQLVGADERGRAGRVRPAL